MLLRKSLYPEASAHTLPEVWGLLRPTHIIARFSSRAWRTTGTHGTLQTENLRDLWKGNTRNKNQDDSFGSQLSYEEERQKGQNKMVKEIMVGRGGNTGWWCPEGEVS